MTTATHLRSATLAGLALVMVACLSRGESIPMMTSTAIPAAQGTVKVSSTKNGNTSIEVKVRHLAVPEKIAPGATTYVVWVRALGQGASQNLGALRVDDDLSGTLKTVTPLRSFDMFITAEASPVASAPTSSPLLTASIAPHGA